MLFWHQAQGKAKPSYDSSHPYWSGNEEIGGEGRESEKQEKCDKITNFLNCYEIFASWKESVENGKLAQKRSAEK